MLYQMMIRMQLCSKWDGLIYFGLFLFFFTICNMFAYYQFLFLLFCHELGFFSIVLFSKWKFISFHTIILLSFAYLLNTVLNFPFRQFCSGIFIFWCWIYISILKILLFIVYFSFCCSKSILFRSHIKSQNHLLAACT